MGDKNLINTIEKPILPEIWRLDKNIIFLNHGSFGSCPEKILELQNEVRERMERQPVQFFVRDLEQLLDSARKTLADFIDADPDLLVFIPNVTYGINCVFNSLNFNKGDEILITNHEYNACKNIAEHTARKSGATIVEAKIPFPITSTDEIIDPILSRITSKTRLALLDHISSQTALIFPVEKIVKELKRKGIPVLIDGAHAPGMVQLSLKKIDADFYTGNCHKWLCSPKGAGFLYVKKEWIGKIRPIAISHGANSPRTDRSRYLIEFGWTGTDDPSPFLCVPESIKYFESAINGGWNTIRERNHKLALAARNYLCEALGISHPCPDEFIGSMASLPIWDACEKELPKSPLYIDRLQNFLWENYKIEVPVIPWEKYPHRLLRISAQLYNHLSQYEKLAEILKMVRDKSF